MSVSSFSIGNLETLLKDGLEETLDFLKDLVAINSFTANAEGVNTNATRIIQQFAPLGFVARQIPCTNPGTGSHLILEMGAGPTLACISHLDTVYPIEEEQRNHFVWQREGDRIFGPGTVDIKGGTAMLWLVIRTLQRADPESFARFRWMLIWNAAEETLSRDFGRLCLDELPDDTRACLVFEGDGRTEKGYAVVRGRKGRGTFDIQVSGRGAHAGGRHQEGANAIHQAARVVEALAGMTDYDRGTTVNVGFIAGGTVINRVPHEASILLELRGSDAEHYASVRTQILALAGEGTVAAKSDGFACKVDVSLTDETGPWPENEKTEQLVRLWKNAAELCGVTLEADFRGGLSDGNYLWQKFPTIDGLGPRGENAHVSERSADGLNLPEFVDVSSFVPKSIINLIAIRQLMEA